MEGILNPRVEPLLQLCERFGIAGNQLAEVEAEGELRHTYTVDAAACDTPDMEVIEAFVAQFGNAAEITIRTGDLIELVVNAMTSHADVARFETGRDTAGSFDIEVRVNKVALAADLFPGAHSRSIRLYLFGSALNSTLQRGIARLEQRLWAAGGAPMVIGVADTDVQLTGPILAVMGGAHFDELLRIANTPAEATDFAAILEARDKYVGWDAPWSTTLTPWHFELSGTCADPTLHGLLRAQLVKLSVLFTCDRARERPTATPPPIIYAQYRGQDHIADVALDERVGLDIDQPTVDAVLASVTWCYRRHGEADDPDWVADRLPFLQTRLAQTLEPLPEGDRLAGLLKSLPHILIGIEWHWKAFIEGKVGEYLQQVNQVEDLVGATTGSIAKETADLTKGLGDAILAAVAALIGSFIAAAFSDPFDAGLFTIGLRVYAIYVLAFPCIIGLLSSNTALTAIQREFNARVERFKETIYPGKVEAIVDKRVDRAMGSYRHWAIAVGAIYGVITIAAWFGATAVPDHISTTTTTTTSTTTTSTTTTSPPPTSALPPTSN